MTKTQYQVQEFAAGKWYPIKSFDTEQEAIEYAATVRNSRVKKVRA